MGAPGARGRLRDTDHLTTEAVVAYVDGELGVGAHQRASGHLSGCEQCTLEVHAQQQARAALRTSGPVSMPSDLLGALCRIPDAWEAGRGALRGATPGRPLAPDAAPPPGSVVLSTHSGYVAVLRPDDFDPDDPGATAGQRPGDPSGRRRTHRRILPFAVVAVSATAGLLVAGAGARAVPVAAPGPARVVVGTSPAAPAATRPAPADADFTDGRAG